MSAPQGSSTQAKDLSASQQVQSVVADYVRQFRNVKDSLDTVEASLRLVLSFLGVAAIVSLVMVACFVLQFGHFVFIFVPKEESQNLVRVLSAIVTGAVISFAFYVYRFVKTETRHDTIVVAVSVALYSSGLHRITCHFLSIFGLIHLLYTYESDWNYLSHSAYSSNVTLALFLVVVFLHLLSVTLSAPYVERALRNTDLETIVKHTGPVRYASEALMMVWLQVTIGRPPPAVAIVRRCCGVSLAFLIYVIKEMLLQSLKQSETHVAMAWLLKEGLNRQVVATWVYTIYCAVPSADAVQNLWSLRSYLYVTALTLLGLVYFGTGFGIVVALCIIWLAILYLYHVRNPPAVSTRRSSRLCELTGVWLFDNSSSLARIIDLPDMMQGALTAWTEHYRAGGGTAIALKDFVRETMKGYYHGGSQDQPEESAADDPGVTTASVFEVVRNMDHHLQSLEVTLACVDEDAILIAIMGTVNVGKSSLLKALLVSEGRHEEAAAIRPSPESGNTIKPALVTWCEEPKICIMDVNGYHSPRLEGIDRHRYEQAVLGKVTARANYVWYMFSGFNLSDTQQQVFRNIYDVFGHQRLRVVHNTRDHSDCNDAYTPERLEYLRRQAYEALLNVIPDEDQRVELMTHVMRIDVPGFAVGVRESRATELRQYANLRSVVSFLDELRRNNDMRENILENSVRSNSTLARFGMMLGRGVRQLVDQREIQVAVGAGGATAAAAFVAIRMANLMTRGR